MTARSERESGFTIIEVVVAALVLTMGALATFGMLSAATKNTYRAKQTQVALDMAQQELETLRGLTTEEVALTSAPPHSSNVMSPDYRVNNGTFAAKQTPLGEYRSLVVNGGELYGGTEEEDVISGGVIEPGPTSFTSGDLTGKIYRYVVWRNDEKCPEATCPGTQDYKQVIVAVKMDQPGNLSTQRGYVEVQSDFIDPLDSKSKDPSPGSGGKVVTAQQFYLTDTPCSSTGTTTRQEITGNHLLHNTLGTCANGLQTGSKQGAPDALVLGAPPDPDPANVNIPELFDYSDDSYLEPTPNTDKGVQIRRDDTNGCHYVPSGVTTPQSQVHRWVSDPMSATFKMTKYATLEFYTRALNDELYPAQLCVYLFKRQEFGSPPVATDTLLINQNGNTPYWTYMPEKTPYWPQNEWKRVRLKMSLKSAPYTLLTGDRLGVALSVERQRTTPADAIAVMYDHPTYPTRLEVETETPIGG